MKKYCLATVTSEEFVPGTLVMLASFLENNPWFDGDIVIIHRRLPEKLQRLLSSPGKARFMEVSQELWERLTLLNRALPHLGLEKKMARFFSLEIFRLKQYRRVYFFDGDIMFTGDVSPLRDAESEGLLCCGDHCHYKGISRDRETFLPIEEPGTGKPLKHTFNSGVMVLDGKLATPALYRGLLELLDPELWQHIKAPHTDQVVLNLYFHDTVKLVGGKYNFLIPFAFDIFEAEGLCENDMCAFHYLGPVKPWRLTALLEKAATLGDSLQYYIDWQQKFRKYLLDIHLRGQWLKWRKKG